MEQSAKLPRERYKANTPWNELGRRQERPGPTAPVVKPYTSFCISTEFKDVSGNGEGRRDTYFLTPGIAADALKICLHHNHICIACEDGT